MSISTASISPAWTGRLAAVAAATLAVLLAAAPVAAEPPPRAPAATVWHLRTDDAMALATWDTCADGVTVETVCERTSVQVVTGRDGDSIVFESYRFVMGPDGPGELLDYTFLSGPVSVSVDRDLADASVDATLEGFRCDVTGDFECTEVGPVQFTGEWEGTGLAEELTDRSTPPPGVGRQDPLYLARTGYVLRDAAVDATLDGAPVRGDLVYAQLATVRGRETMVCRGGPAMQEFCSFGP